MEVLSFSERRRAEAVEMLHGLLAEAEEGELIDMAACITDKNGREHTILTGRYRRDPGATSNAGFRLQYRAMEAANDDSMDE